MRKSLIILILSVAFCYYFLANQTKPERCTIQQAQALKKALSQYFAYLFCKEDFGYALIGAKPMSFTIDFPPTPLASNIKAFPHTFCNSDHFLFRVWKWNKHNNAIVTVFIHKKLFLQTYEDNKEIFQKILGNSLSAKALLHTIATSEKNIFEIIKHSEMLLGIILGFGKGNAALFARYDKIFPRKYSLLNQHGVHFSLTQQYRNSSLVPKLLLPSAPFKTLEEEQTWFVKYFSKGSYNQADFKIVDLVFPVGFRVTDSEETKKLIKRYTKAKQILTKLFSERDCLEVVEAQLQATHPIIF